MKIIPTPKITNNGVGRSGAPAGGSAGACGGTRRQDGSGGGTGNIGTVNQPKK